MKVKLGQIVAGSEPLGRLMGEKVGVQTAFRMAGVLKKVQAELETYDETRKGLIEKHGKDGEIKPESKNWEKFLTEMNELLETEVKLDVEKVKSENLAKIECSATDLVALDWLIEE
mgnify:CR=1 FL=1